ncbi:MAG TPA: hypothetical protein VFG46_26990 [Chryseolinea sp.]|nr:hypothetical protein [Chryseolinea sp.]
MEYSKFKVEEFVTDEYFVRWIKKPDVETNVFWNSWLSKNLQQLPSIRNAREIILHLDFRINRPPEGRFLAVWERIIIPEPEHHRGTFSGESNGNGSGHNIKMDFVNIYRFRHWEWAARQLVVQHFSTQRWS